MFFSTQQLLNNSKPADKWGVTKFIVPGVNFFSSVDYASGALIGVASGNGYVVRSTDGCQTFTSQSLGSQYWNTITGPLGSYFGSQWAAYGTNGMNGAQALSTDNGVTWTTKTFALNNGASFANPTQSYVYNSFWVVTGDQGMLGVSVSGDQTPTFAVPALARNHTGAALGNDGKLVLADQGQTTFYWYDWGNPSINGYWNFGYTNCWFATTGNGVMAFVLGGTSIATSPNVSTAPTVYAVPAAILQGRFISRLYWNPWRLEWVIIGNNQGLPNPLAATSPDLVNWTDISSGINTSNLVGALNDVVWDYDHNMYVFAANARQMMIDGALIMTYKP